jgi:crotonobetainyl-CoA:carnitine CoA-transferase CaiB-like acyl-CoA transferase
MAGDQPLTGVRVLDLSQLLPGPACTVRLAWLGAEIVKVEPPAGDPARTIYGGVLWDQFNRGKRSVVLNLKDAGDRQRALELAKDADVVVEGFRPGVAERLGVGFDAVRALRSDVVYCSIVGFPPGNEHEHEPSHDLTFMAEAGALGAAGSWSAQGAAPVRPLVPMGDLFAAGSAVEAILAALLRRARTGEGARITISMLDALRYAVAARGPIGADGDVPHAHLDPANDLYRTADGRYIAIAALEPKFWDALCTIFELDDELCTEARTWSWQERQAHGDEIAAALASAFAKAPAEELCERLRRAGTPAAIVRSPREALGDGWIAPPLPFGADLDPAPVLDDGREERR